MSLTPEEWKAKLSEEEHRVMRESGTERPHTSELNAEWRDGEYSCKGCGTVLFQSEAKFNAGCGWPSFDDEIKGAVKKVTDADGRRTEIICNNCNGHLGHVFYGEGFTEKNTRHCVNSMSLIFISKSEN